MNFHVNWTDEETQELIKVWSEEKIQVDLGESVRNGRVYGEVSRRLAALEMYRSAKQCREKIKKLKLEYRRTKKHSEESVDIKKNFKWYEALDSIMSEKSDSREDHVLPDTMIQAFMISDLETDLAKKTETLGSCSNSCTTSQSAEETPSPPETKEDPGFYIVQVEDVDVPSTSASVKSTAMPTSSKDSRWSKREVQALLTLWANPAIQEELCLNVRNSKVYTRLSGALETLGFSKTPQKCREKIKKLKQDYRRMKNSEQQRSRTMWFSIIDDVLGSKAAAPTCSETTECSLTSQRNCLMDVITEDETLWQPDEIQVLMTLWAQPNIQKQLFNTETKTQVFKYLSSELAMVGFNKTANQCSMKVNSLKEEYKKTKETEPNGEIKSDWLVILDGVFGQCTGIFSEEDPSVVLSQTKSPEEVHEKDCSLSVSSLCLLVPTLRLMCGFAWQVVQCCNVMHYGKVEELVRVATELAPDLLTPREKVQILLRLRARMVLELCSNEITANQLSVQPHLMVINNITTGCTCNQEEQEELENSKTNFVEVIQRLLEDKEERKAFFKEVFPLHYGQQYEDKLKTLVWKFISKLDSLLPVPDIKQTADWLGSAPTVMEECGRLVLEPAELKAIFSFQQQQTGVTNKYHSQTGNLFLPRLSLPPKQNQEHPSQQQDLSTVHRNDKHFSCSVVKENTNVVTLTQQDCNKADEVLMLKDEEIEEPTTESSSNFTDHTPLGQQSCFLCSYSDDQVTGLMQHMREAHPVQKPSRLQPKEPDTDKASKKASKDMCTSEIKSTTFPCEYCGKVFKYVSKLRDHIKTHTMPFRCDKCDKKYASMSSLYVHQMNHTGELPYLCSHCGRGFKTSGSLRAHVHIHTGERRYKCHICGKTSIQHLARHMRMHRGEKNYLCTECGKAFLSSGELKLHIRYHTGERPYTCKHCGKGFVAKCFLTVHMRRHTGESPYKCLVCPKAFHTLRAQKKHMKIHSNLKSFQCLKCGKIFRHVDTYKMHVKTHE